MTATTPRGYPYPEGTDLLGDTHLAIQALAEAVDDDLTGAGWQTLTLVNGWAAYGAPFTTPRYRKTPGGLVLLDGLLSGNASTSGLIATLPAGYRPAGTVLLIAASAETDGERRIDVSSAGAVSVSGWSGTYDYQSLSGLVFLAEA